MKKAVVKVLKKALKEKGVHIKNEEIEKVIEIPSHPELGDYSFPCFFLTEKLRDNPSQIAIELREKIGNVSPTDFQDVQSKGPYVNFFFNRTSLARQVIWDSILKKRGFGMTNIGKRKKVVIEFSSPNIARSFGIGHLRSTIIGNSLANIFEFQGFKVIRMNYPGDWGTQFGKLILGFEKFGSEKKLEKEPIKHLMEIYVKANKKQYEKGARAEFKKLEEGNRKSLMLWKVFKEVSFVEFEKIYKIFRIKFDAVEGESKYNKKTKKIIRELKEKKLLKKSEGAHIVDLKEYNLGISLIEKSDGATLYSTRDLAAAIERYKKYKFERMIYEVGQEQKLYFKQIFKILELMGYDWAKNCEHIYHGHYLDKDGKRFRTRKGKTVFMEDVLNKTIAMAEKEIKKRDPKISKEEIRERAERIAVAAIVYGDLKNNHKNNVVFDIKKFISFDGNTGPYLLYSYARASSIMKKAEEQKKFKVYDLEEEEMRLVKKLSQFPEVVINAYNSLNPTVIANYSYQLAKLFNEFYHECEVIGSEQEVFRLALVQSFRQVLRRSLKLLGIDTIEEM